IFSRCIRKHDLLMMPEIYYAGGTASKDISSREIVDEIRANGRDARYFKNREEIVPVIAAETSPGDVVLVLGARDNSLTDFCRDIVENL
ncbi:MAG: UDP-N-acetylmuramate--alanine ligase, partial [Chloroflexi bacterium]|nr:UDP-N-acetylmuramate--alanine ligase [Chloroflexota bacterium]